MTIREALQILKPFKDCMIDQHGCPISDAAIALDVVIKELENKEWTPCSEQLPSEKGEYLVTYHPCYWDNVESEVRVGIDTFRGKTSWAKKKYQKVIAWKPLPMAWEGADNEADKSQSE